MSNDTGPERDRPADVYGDRRGCKGRRPTITTAPTATPWAWLRAVAVLIPLATGLILAQPAAAQGTGAYRPSVVVPGVPSLVSTSSGSVVVGQQITDTAVISGGTEPTGSVSFDLYQPGDPHCASAPVFHSVMAVAGDGLYQSRPFTTVSPGVYRWVASYSGDAGNLAVDGMCATGGQSVAVILAVPALVTVASPSVVVGGSVTDSATVSGASRPTGTLTFKLFGPGTTDQCSTRPVFVSGVAIKGTGTYLSPPFTPQAPGTYRWTVAYSGDSGDVAQTSRCEAGSQDVVVQRAATRFIAGPPPSVSLGQAIVANVVLVGGFHPTGSLVYAFFGPGDAGCSAAPLRVSAPRPVAGAGPYQSPPFTPADAGSYPFVVSYRGDANNADEASGCVSGASAPEVSRATLTIKALVIGPVAIGHAVVATDLLTGGLSPTGTIVFSFFRPDDRTCAGKPVFSSRHVPVSGNGQYSSEPFEPSVPGTFHFVATYSGDRNNAGNATLCSAANQSVEVVPATDPRARKFVALEVSAFALISVVAAPGREEGQSDETDPAPDPSPDPSQDPSQDSSQAPSQGSVAAVGIDDSREGWEGVEVATDARTDGSAGDGTDDDEDEGTHDRAGGSALPSRIGDRSRTWQWPGTVRLDQMSSTLPMRAAPASPTVALVLNDGGYLRAMLGSAAALLPVLGAALGVLAVRSTDGRALPPEFALAMALAVLSVLDSLAGFVGLATFVVGVVALGGLASFDDLRTLLGLSALWFAAPLIAGTARPLRRAASSTRREHWDRMADVVIGSLFGAWAVEQILQGLPGLAGTALPIAARAATAGLIVLAALAMRLVLETIAAHGYPDRLRHVQPASIPGSSAAQHHAAALVGSAIFAFVALPYLGPCWQLFAGGAVFFLPPTLRIYKGRFPNTPRLYALVPQGIVRAVTLLVVGGLVGALVLNAFQDHPQQLIRDSFVLLLLPGFAFSMLDLFARDGEVIRAPHWLRQLTGALVLATGLLLVVGVIAV